MDDKKIAVNQRFLGILLSDDFRNYKFLMVLLYYIPVRKRTIIDGICSDQTVLTRETTLAHGHDSQCSTHG